MFNFIKNISDIVLIVAGLMIVIVCLSAVLYQFNKELALFLTQYILPIFFLLFFVSIFKDYYEER